MDLLKLYENLLEKYGYQGWWPVTPIGGCTGEKHIHPIYGVKSINDKQKLEIIFGTILTQNTTWKNVEQAIIKLNEKDLIDIDKITKIKKEELGQLIKSSGYFNQKSECLKNICQFLKKCPIQKLENIDLLKARELLLAVKGIGKETADSILLFALNKPIFIVDTYTKRFLLKLNLIDDKASYDKIQKVFMKALPKDIKLFKEFHALIVEHNKRFLNKSSI